MADVAPLELAARLALALGLALFLGLAFEEAYKRDERSIPGGVRTFPMFTLAGAMLYLIEPRYALAFIAGLVATAIWHHAHLRAAAAGGTTTLMIPVSNLVAYLLGPVALTQPPWVAVSASVAAVLLLGTREKLHELIKIVPPDELLTAGKFLILVGIILPLVPNQPVTTLTQLTPYHVWLAVVAICSLSYVTYLLRMYAPARNATLLPAILGGIYSSTATTIVLARRQGEATVARSDLAAGIVIATAVMYVRLGVVIALFNPRFALALLPALGALFAFGAGARCLRVATQRHRSVRQEPGNPGGQSVANTHGARLRCDLCRHLRAHRMDPYFLWPDRRSGVGGHGRNNRHRSVRGQYRARRSAGSFGRACSPPPF